MNWMGKGRNQRSLLLREEKKIKEHFDRKQVEKREKLKQKYKSNGVSTDLLHLACVSATSRTAFVSNSQLPYDQDQYEPSKIKINDGKGEKKENSKDNFKPTVNSRMSFNKGIDDVIFSQSTPLASQVATKKKKSSSFSAGIIQPEINQFSDMSKLDLISPICTISEKTSHNNFNNSCAYINSSLQNTIEKDSGLFMSKQELMCDSNYEINSGTCSNDQYDIKLGCDIEPDSNFAKFDLMNSGYMQPFCEDGSHEVKMETNKHNSVSLSYFESFDENKFDNYFAQPHSLYDEEFGTDEFISNKENMNLFDDDLFPTFPTNYSFIQHQNRLEKPATPLCLSSKSISDESIFMGQNRKVLPAKRYPIHRRPTISPEYLSPNKTETNSNLMSFSPIFNQDLYPPGPTNENIFPSNTLVHTPNLVSPKNFENNQKNNINEDCTSQIVPPVTPPIKTKIYRDAATSPIKWPTSCASVQTG